MTMRSLLATLLCLAAFISSAALGPPIAMSPAIDDDTGSHRSGQEMASNGDGFLAVSIFPLPSSARGSSSVRATG
jgi:hypothetical protein